MKKLMIFLFWLVLFLPGVAQSLDSLIVVKYEAKETYPLISKEGSFQVPKDEIVGCFLCDRFMAVPVKNSDKYDIFGLRLVRQENGSLDTLEYGLRLRGTLGRPYKVFVSSFDDLPADLGKIGVRYILDAKGEFKKK
ncbi:unnamed protein product [marine sediment metagenome]|uniref:Uncharacterized protein n=1 Tax=marine sediment metagenome TaxID=412755 RepID=X0WHG9_9ZZZZ